MCDVFPLLSSNKKNAICYVRLVIFVYFLASENSEIINNYVAFEVQDSMQTELTSGIILITYMIMFLWFLLQNA